MNILIVEENNRDRSLLRSVLEQHGCLVTEAEDGLEGLDLAIHQHPDVIISNTLMPRMDGFQLLWALKSDPKLTSIPFLFYSDTHTGEQESKLALSLGAAAFVVKKDTPETIWEKISALVQSEKNNHEKQIYPPIDKTDRTYLWEYSRITATKLEGKVRELEEALARRRQDASTLRRLNKELTREIAEHQRAEESIREQEQELSSIFEVAPFLMLLLDEDRKVRRANTFACTYTGTSVSDIIGRKGGEVLRCLHALDTPEGCGFGPHCQQCAIRLTAINTFETGRSHHGVEASLPICINNVEKTLTFLLSTSRITTGTQSMVLLGVQDITRQKSLEICLNEAWKRESLSLMTAGIAREFGTLLPSMIEYVENILTGLPVYDSFRQKLEHALNAAKKAERLTHELSQYQNEFAVDPECIDLNAPIRAIESDLVRIGGPRITCTLQLSHPPLPVFADVHQIELLVKNIAEHARNSLSRGGTLTLFTESARINSDFTASQGLGHPGAYALLTARYSECNVVPHNTCLEPDAPDEENRTGSNLGLGPVNSIIQRHDGFIQIQKDAGEGTTIRAYIPLRLPETGERPEVPGPEQLAKGKETILLAEDDESVRNMAVAILQHFGYEVIEAVDGEDAVIKYRKNREKINLLLFDLVMPKKSGNDAYDEIRKLNPEIKVLFASGIIPEITRQKSLAGNKVAFIYKPYQPTAFLQKVRNILDGS